MIATDPLSLLYVACVVFAGAFIILTTVLGVGQGHGLHVGSHGLHLGGPGAHASGHGLHLGAHAGTHVSPSHAATSIAGHGAPPSGTRVTLPQQSAATGAAQTDAHGFSLGQLIGSVNLNAVLVFLFCFGLVGYILHNATQVGSLWVIALAIILGLIAAGGVNMLYLRLFGEESGRLGVASSEIEGRVATVSTAIRAGGIGEVLYMGDNGTRKSLSARSSDGSAIDRDADVVIVGYRDGIALVQTWDNFLASATSAGA